MTQLLPFRALRYNLDKITSLTDVTAPPYDVIEADHQQELYDKHPANVIRLILNQKTPNDTAQDSVYTRAADFLSQWQQDGTLIQEQQPAFYAYSQCWEQDGKRVERKGMIGLLKLESYESGKVIPHERIIKKYIADRFELMKATMANLSQVFMIYTDEQRQVEAVLFANDDRSNWASAIDRHGVEHLMKPVTDTAVTERLQKVFADKPVLIADGHHRYQTALNYKEQVRSLLGDKAPPDGQLLSDYVMVFLANADDPGLIVQPTHRVLCQWPSGWDQSRFEAALLEVFEKTSNDQKTDLSYWAMGQSSAWALRVKNPDAVSALPALMRDLDVALLADTILQGILGQSVDTLKESGALWFTQNPAEVGQLLESGKAVAGFLMKPPSVHQIFRICETGDRMPQKSTYFYPKVLTGLVFHSYLSADAVAGVSPLPQNLFGTSAALEV